MTVHSNGGWKPYPDDQCAAIERAYVSVRASLKLKPSHQPLTAFSVGQQGRKGSHALPGGKYKIVFDNSMRQVQVGNESKRRHVRRKAPAEGVPPQRARAGPSFP